MLRRKVKEAIYKEIKDMSEIISNGFLSVFSLEKNFVKLYTEDRPLQIEKKKKKLQRMVK